MLVLLDESLPRQLARELTGIEVRTVHRQGWRGLSNGELLGRAEAAGFDVFLTADQNLEYQQNIARYGLGVVVSSASKNRLQDLLPLIPETIRAIRNAKPGEVYLVRS